MSLFTNGANITLKEIMDDFKTKDALHDAIADATDGTEPKFYIEEVGYVTLFIEEGTGSTLCDINDDEYYLSDLMHSIEAELTNPLT